MRESVLRQPPSNVMVELTNRCQLHCITCPREYAVGRSNIAMGDMPLRDFKALVDRDLHRCSFLSLTGGGETFLYPHLVEAVDYALEKNPHVQIFLSTNAMVAKTTSLVRALVGKVRTLQVSVDGTGSAFEQVRRPACFATFRGTVQEIAALTAHSTTEMTFNMVLLRETVGEIVPVLELAAEMGVRRVSLAPINLVLHEWSESYYDFYRTTEAVTAVRQACEHAARAGIELSYFDLASSEGFRSCPFPWDAYYITWDGFLVPCCAKPAPRLLNFGRVVDRGLLACVNDPAFVEFRQRSESNVSPPFCARCHFLVGPSWGTGGSPQASEARQGRLAWLGKRVRTILGIR
jgi:MoaA/NifB/PqqE/SkfB family radical SAM enzyme